MTFINKSNGLFFYLSGLTVLFLTYAFFEPIVASNVNSTTTQTTSSAIALVKLFYAFGMIFIILGIFIFALSSLFSKRKEHFA